MFFSIFQRRIQFIQKKEREVYSCWLLSHIAPAPIEVRTTICNPELSSGCHFGCAMFSTSRAANSWMGFQIGGRRSLQHWSLITYAVRSYQSQHPAHKVSVIMETQRYWLTIAVQRQDSIQGWRSLWLSVNDLQHPASVPNMAVFSKGECIVIL